MHLFLCYFLLKIKLKGTPLNLYLNKYYFNYFNIIIIKAIKVEIDPIYIYFSYL